mmetsp:Transcript_19958/g.47146  ORF Transcript_19958/g.47146 Transcript_19958/m.47146 type:complete len:210 (-) Transcript_19958:319-948(-)
MIFPRWSSVLLKSGTKDALCGSSPKRPKRSASRTNCSRKPWFDSTVPRRRCTCSKASSNVKFSFTISQQITIQAERLCPAWQFTSTFRFSARQVARNRSEEGHDMSTMSKKSRSSLSASWYSTSYCPKRDAKSVSSGSRASNSHQPMRFSTPQMLRRSKRPRSVASAKSPRNSHSKIRAGCSPGFQNLQGTESRTDDTWSSACCSSCVG